MWGSIDAPQVVLDVEYDACPHRVKHALAIEWQRVDLCGVDAAVGLRDTRHGPLERRSPDVAVVAVVRAILQSVGGTCQEVSARGVSR